jgi:CRISPR-associated protein Cmr6
VLDVLFGREPPEGDSDAVRGALSFWDVIPQIEGNSLMVEIMTPHQKHYYQDSQSPHDSGQPNPIAFLTVPPGSQFTFHVVCDRLHLERLTKERSDGAIDVLTEENGVPRWQQLLAAAFEHAFEWLGFGAKTAVGYGAMKSSKDHAGDTVSERAKDGGAEEPARRTPSAAAREETWPAARLSWSPGAKELRAFSGNQSTGPLKGEAADKLIAELGESANRLRRDKELKNVAVRVRIEGNSISLLGLAPRET